MIPSTCPFELSSLGKPRASGDDPWGALVTLWHGLVNPARAGMIPLGGPVLTVDGGKPRASGDDPHPHGRPPAPGR